MPEQKEFPRAVHKDSVRALVCGESVYWDTLEGRWLAGTARKLHLIAMIDEATGQSWARLADDDSPLENLRLLRSYVQAFGRPLECIFGRRGFCHPRFRASGDNHESIWEGPGHIFRALQKLQIRWIPAHSEHNTARSPLVRIVQRRLIQAIKQSGFHDGREANPYLEEVFFPAWNEKAAAAAMSGNAHRPLLEEHDSADIFCLHAERIVGDKLTVRLGGVFYEIEAAEAEHCLRNARVEVLRSLDGRVSVKWNDRLLGLRPPSNPVSGRRVAPKEPSPWMKNFNLRDSPPLYRILKQSEWASRH